jgi:DNA-binding NarL/FixJ family response regulator
MADAELDMLLADMRQEFIENCEDRLDEVEDSLEQGIDGQVRPDRVLLDIKRNIHSIKGLGTSFGFSSITLFAHSLEDYIETCEEIDKDHLKDIQYFVDRIRDILESGVNLTDDEAVEIIHRLPLHKKSSSQKLNQQDIRVLFLMPKGLQRKIIGRELSTFGFNVIIAETGIAAIDLAITHKPDIIISSMHVNRFSGVELAHIFYNIEATHHARFLLMAASDISEKVIANLPANTTILRKGMAFSKDLFQFLKDNRFLG